MPAAGFAAAVEYRGETEKTALDTIAEKIAANIRVILETARSKGVPPREAAMDLARGRLERAMDLRRWQA
jgi:glutamate dehydrogenase (NAD(P)+)